MSRKRRSDNATAPTASTVSSPAATTKGASGSVVVARVGFLIVVAGLVIFGLIMLYSASSVYSYNQTGDYTYVFYKQTIFVAIGIVLALIIAIVPYQKYSLGLCAAALIICIPLLVLVLTEGNDALGARRWIDLGFTTLQPSEFAKIALMLVLAHLVDRCRTDGYSGALIVVMIIACVIPIGLIIVEPDLGTTIIAGIGILAVLWFGGVPKRIVGILALSAVILAVLAIVGTGFRQTRITSWLDPWSDPQESGYQLLSSYYAFGGGGVFGVGLGLSKQKFNWLPQSENDFLFAIVGEELGLIGALLVMLLFVGLVIMALRIAANAPDARGAMIAGASGVIIGGQAFLNMLCVIGALPTTGKPLPFFSAGGSSVISTMILVGLILSVSLQSTEATVYDFRREQFTVVSGNSTRGLPVGGRSSVLSRLPNPAAVVGALLPKPAAPKPVSQERRRSTAPASIAHERGRGDGSSRAVQEHGRDAFFHKVIPISRGKAERSTREAQATRTREIHQTAPSRRQSEDPALTSTHKQDRAPQAAPRHRAAEAPLSMASLRRNRVRRAGSGGRSA